jgi:glycine/D-amino acid oxidase-like deaminating enzyme
MGNDSMYDAIIIGGGFYGASIAIYLKTKRGFENVLLVERESNLLLRASYNNQARVHNGYHYPRSFTTAFRSRVNLPQFIQDYPQTVKRDFTKLYAIARRNSKVSAKQFERFCREIGAKLEPAPDNMLELFETRLIEDVFLAEEYAFDAAKLAEYARQDLNQCGVEIRLNTSVSSIQKLQNGLSVSFNESKQEILSSRYVFNCTYSGLNQIKGDFPGTQTKLKHEITEMGLIQVPPILASIGVTVMDGPFFSMMPFPAEGLHTLSHVRYTPHNHWVDQPNLNPYQKLDSYDCETRIDRMVRDVSRYMPSIQDAKYVESLFEIKTVLVKNEGDDGRPILFENHFQLPGCYSILGGKIDNIFDVLEKLDSEQLDLI